MWYLSKNRNFKHSAEVPLDIKYFLIPKQKIYILKVENCSVKQQYLYAQSNLYC